MASLRDSRANWSPDELAALNDVAKGSPTQRALRVVGALAPDSPITALLHAGGLVCGIATGGARGGRLARNNGGRPGAQDCGQSAHEVGGQQSEQYHSIGRPCADNACAYGAVNRLAFGGVAHGLGGQRARTGAALCAGAWGGVRLIAGTADGKLTYAGATWTHWNAGQGSCRSEAAPRPAGAEACRRDYLFDLDGGQPFAPHGLGLREDKPAADIRREAAGARWRFVGGRGTFPLGGWRPSSDRDAMARMRK
jgi:hypothetical protein